MTTESVYLVFLTISCHVNNCVKCWNKEVEMLCLNCKEIIPILTYHYTVF